MVILTGCSSKRALDNIGPIPTDIEVFNPQSPAALNLEEEKFQECPTEDPAVYICLDEDGVQSIFRNKVKIIRHINDLNAIIEFYSGPSD